MAFFEEIRKGTTGALDRAKLVFTNASPSDDVEEQQQPDRLEELAEYCPKLTYQQRLMGFLVSFGFGYMIAFCSFSFFVRMVEGNPLPFAINYTTGHILQLMASTFLCGPKQQFKNMFDEKRRTTSIVYLSCLATTIVIIFVPIARRLSFIKLILLLLTMGTQFCASTWYSLSYIPYGRQTALRMIKRCAGIEESNNRLGTTTIAGITLPTYSGVMS